MVNKKILQSAINEINSKKFGFTQQFLKVHELEYINNQPIIEDVLLEKNNAIVYFKVKNERFYLAVHINNLSKNEVFNVTTENFNSIFLQVESKNLSSLEISAFTKLNFTRKVDIGDPKGSTFHNVTKVYFEPDYSINSFENRLIKFLDYLEQDVDGVITIKENCETVIRAIVIYHNGNTDLGGFQLNNDVLKRLANLDLSIEFDFYAEGNFFI